MQQSHLLLESSDSLIIKPTNEEAMKVNAQVVKCDPKINNLEVWKPQHGQMYNHTVYCRILSMKQMAFL